MISFDVFISYPHQDKPIADGACAKLEASGIRCWIAPRDVPPGKEWAAAIIDAIDHSRVMVLIFSSGANQSKQVHREVQRAFDREVPVVPLRIENVAPEKSLAYYMGPVHWLDALTPPLEKHLQQLAESVRALTKIKSEESVQIPIKDVVSSPEPSLGWSKLDEMLKIYRGNVAIKERLAAADPSNTQWQRDLSRSYEKVGSLLTQ
jgi:hypothetical protein